MKTRSWWMLAAAFGLLIGMIGLLGLGAMQRARAIHNDMTAAHNVYLETESFLRDIPAELHLAGIYARDYLLDPSHLMAPYYKDQIQKVRAALLDRLNSLEQRMSSTEALTLHELRAEVEAYWKSLDPIFEWSPKQMTVLGTPFLRREVLPRRAAVLALSREVTRLNAASLERERQRLSASQDLFQTFVRRMTLVLLSMGLVVALVTAGRLAQLEARQERHREATDRAHQELRRLSSRLVRAQEEERKSLSRELHDAVGQMLTALKMDLANLDEGGNHSAGFRDRLDSARSLTDQTLRTVRDLAMGLRPSMLDDLGLGPALEWQTRDFSRRTGVPAGVRITGSVDALPESHRTCIFRVVQEALTNVARHAGARNVSVSVRGGIGSVSLRIQDDGAGFDAARTPRAGLGLTGIEERVRELGGEMTLSSRPGHGTILEVDAPVPELQRV